jgi:hypothetical protein
VPNIITVAHDVNETDTLMKTGRTLVRGSHRPLHGVANVKSLVANDEIGFKVLTLKNLLECRKVRAANRETRNGVQGVERNKNGSQLRRYGEQTDAEDH